MEFPPWQEISRALWVASNTEFTREHIGFTGSHWIIGFWEKSTTQASMTASFGCGYPRLSVTVGFIAAALSKWYSPLVCPFGPTYFGWPNIKCSQAHGFYVTTICCVFDFRTNEHNCRWGRLSVAQCGSVWLRWLRCVRCDWDVTEVIVSQSSVFSGYFHRLNSRHPAAVRVRDKRRQKLFCWTVQLWTMWTMQLSANCIVPVDFRSKIDISIEDRKKASHSVPKRYGFLSLVPGWWICSLRFCARVRVNAAKMCRRFRRPAQTLRSLRFSKSCRFSRFSRFSPCESCYGLWPEWHWADCALTAGLSWKT